MVINGGYIDITSNTLRFNTNGTISSPNIVTSGGGAGIVLSESTDTINLTTTGASILTIGGTYSTFNSNVILSAGKKLFFDSDIINTYIWANNDNPEDIEIHADQDIILLPDNKTIVSSPIQFEYNAVKYNITTQSSLGTFDAGSDVAEDWGSTTTTVAGECYYWDGTDWSNKTDASAVSGSTGFIGIATDTTGSNVLIKGNVIAKVQGSISVGDPVYLQITTGLLGNAAPSGSGEIVRIVGRVIEAGGGQNHLIYFNPSNDWLELT
jgi:hypothetical protein